MHLWEVMIGLELVRLGELSVHVVTASNWFTTTIRHRSSNLRMNPHLPSPGWVH
jgi:hypothetical protein